MKTNRRNFTRVEICGGIASGKTTLARQLRGKLDGIVTENFEQNPFFEQFYAKPSEVAFETEITFLLQHYNSIGIAKKEFRSFAIDTSLLQDKAYAAVNLKGSQLSVFDAVFSEAWQTLGPPDRIVWLECPPQEQLRRIANRARRPEQQIEIPYLVSLNQAIGDVLSKFAPPNSVIRINSEKINFVDNQQDIDSTIDRVLQI